MKKLVLVTLLTALMPLTSSAKNGFLKSFKAQYPNAKVLAAVGCGVCHKGDSEELNPYGLTLKGTLSTNAGKPSYADSEAVDSDGDGFKNIEEINANTEPGNFDSRPANH